MNLKKPLTAKQRAARVRIAQACFEAKRTHLQKTEDRSMSFFTISEEEDITLDNMTSRALANEPTGSQALFDTHGVFIANQEGQITEIKDFIISNPVQEQTFDWMTNNYTP